MSEKTLTLFLVRHGEAENNVRSILNSAPVKKEYPLTEKGREQVQATARHLASVGADIIFSSPILRARETAEIIAEKTNLPILIDERLWEVRMGVFNEEKQSKMLAKYPETEMRLSPENEDEMESFLEVRSRLDTFLEELKEKYAEKKVIVVSHSDPLEQLHGILTAEGPGLAAMGWHPEKGECTKIVYKFA